MNICVLFFGGGKHEKMSALARGLARGLESQGMHTVQIIDGEKETDRKLTGFHYIAVGAPAVNLFGGKIPSSVKKYLQNCGMISGKRSFAFTLNSGLRMMKTLQTIMKTMESEGMFLKVSDILHSDAQAEAIGARLHVE